MNIVLGGMGGHKYFCQFNEATKIYRLKEKVDPANKVCAFEYKTERNLHLYLLINMLELV